VKEKLLIDGVNTFHVRFGTTHTKEIDDPCVVEVRLPGAPRVVNALGPANICCPVFWVIVNPGKPGGVL
jgi:hypothetical protein